jgi:protein SCO1/2
LYFNSINSNFGRAPVWLLSAIVIIVSTLGGAWLWHLMDKSAVSSQDRVLVLYPEPRDVADLKLIDHRNQPFTLWQMRDYWSVLFFGFTACPDICPDTLYKMQQVNATLTADHPAVADRIKYYFISVDPERDTPERIAEYIGYFDPEFTGLTGEPAMLQAMGMQLGVGFHIEQHPPGAREYGVDHSAGMVLLNPAGQLYGIFRPPHDVAAVTAEIEQLLKAES